MSNTITQAQGFQSSQFRGLSSWRQDDVTIKAGETKQIPFLDTKPNMFLVVNFNAVELYAGIQRIPTREKYEAKIEKNGPTTFGRPLPTGQVYIYNPASTDITIALYSVYGEFDINIMKPVTVTMEGANVGQDMYVAGFNTGVALPAGNNKIGSVELGGDTETILSNIQANTNNTASAVAGTGTQLSNANTTLTYIFNQITDLLNGSVVADKVNMASLVSAINALQGVSSMTFSDVVGKLNALIEKMGETTAGGEEGETSGSVITDLYVNEATAGETVDFTTENIIPNYLVLFSNDGETDITLTLVLDESASISRAFTVKAGEALSDLPIKMYGMTVAPKTSGEAIAWRMLGGLK